MPDLERLTQRLQADFGLAAVVACEIEFYLPGGEAAQLDGLWHALRLACAQRNVGIYKIEKERGLDQYEVSLAPYASAPQGAIALVLLKQLLEQCARDHNLSVDFSAKPFADRPGSALHVHLHLTDMAGNNLFYKKDVQMSDALVCAMGGLLSWLPASMPVFAPTAASYARFTAGDDHVPTTVCWGANNRTAALRLPDSESGIKHIEHRIPGADADPMGVIAVILAAIHNGFVRKLTPGPQIYGNAADAQYNLPDLPTNLEEARRMQAEFTEWKKYFIA